ncbi:hypothetical protein ILUMI_24071 [Ignelater luminosus]|uniref:Uncharacterized protein n=1 Tax=Ignelater luminosus TaxID=2038154 RepID=A0A8K0CB79_IGNLU|nr:hypothetical protein ILUMI_24071 [Ignelater luminosus]
MKDEMVAVPVKVSGLPKSTLMSEVEYILRMLENSLVNPKPDTVQVFGKLTNTNITEAEIKLALSQIKKDRAPGRDGITREMMQLGRVATVKSIDILLNKCL